MLEFCEEKVLRSIVQVGRVNDDCVLRKSGSSVYLPHGEIRQKRVNDGARREQKERTEERRKQNFLDIAKRKQARA